MTFVLGLTGSIGMGKSATAGLFRELGVPVHDADACVHRLYGGRAVPEIESAFPGVVVNGSVDRARLSERVLGRGDEMRRLEAIVHPLVRSEEVAFLCGVAGIGRGLAVLDVPLLLETGAERRCDAVLVVTAEPRLQAERVLARPGMTTDRLALILAKQMPDSEKRRRAHFVVDTGSGFPRARRQVSDIVRALAGRPGHVISRAQAGHEETRSGHSA